MYQISDESEIKYSMYQRSTLMFCSFIIISLVAIIPISSVMNVCQLYATISQWIGKNVSVYKPIYKVSARDS